MLRNHFLSINFNRKIKFANCTQAELLEYVNSKNEFHPYCQFRIPPSKFRNQINPCPIK